jgi:hypothetical protein
MTTIRIKGKQYPCYMTMGAIVYFKRLAGKDISRMNPTDVEENLMVLYCVVRAASRAEGVEFDADFGSYEDFANAITPDEMQQWQQWQAEQAEKEQADYAAKKKKTVRK